MFTEIFETHRQPSIIVAGDMTVKMVNHAAATLMACEVDEAAGKPLSNWIDLSLLAAKFDVASGVGNWVPLPSNQPFGDKKQPCDILIRRLRKSGSERLFWLLISVSHENRTTFRNLRKEVVNAQAHASAEKAHNELLAESNRKLKTFAYTAAHDISGPLRRIVQCLNMYKRADEEELENAERLLEIAEISASSLRQLVTDLLTYSQASNEEMELTPIDLSAFIIQNLDMLDTTDLSPDWLHIEKLPIVSCSSHQISSVLQNLLGNAIKYRHPDRALQVIISCRHLVEGWRLIFEDNGLGFAPEHANRLFDPFFRTHPDIVGTGIGLATCAEFINNHGWSISAQGEVNKGARFEIMIPATSIAAE